MKRSITLGELILASMTVIGSILGFWINTSSRLAVLENSKSEQQTNYIEMKTDMRESFQKLSDKVDKINEGNNEIKVTLQNKQDRK